MFAVELQDMWITLKHNNIMNEKITSLRKDLLEFNVQIEVGASKISLFFYCMMSIDDDLWEYSLSSPPPYNTIMHCDNFSIDIVYSFSLGNIFSRYVDKRFFIEKRLLKTPPSVPGLIIFSLFLNPAPTPIALLYSRLLSAAALNAPAVKRSSTLESRVGILLKIWFQTHFTENLHPIIYLMIEYLQNFRKNGWLINEKHGNKMTEIWNTARGV